MGYLLVIGSLVCFGTFSLARSSFPVNFDVDEINNYGEIKDNNFINIEGKSDESTVISYRLPDALEPISYIIRILPILDETPKAGVRYTAPGTVTIAVKCVQNTNIVVLHSKSLNITKESVKVRNVATGEFLEILSQDIKSERDFFNISLSSTLVQGSNYEIRMDYVAHIRPAEGWLNALHLAKYTAPGESEPRYMATTQLEPVAARQVYPCFDEPRFKSVFSVTVGRTRNYTALGNERSIRIEDHETLNGWVWETFAVTVPMPTYLFAIAVTDFESVKAKSDLYRLPVSVYGPPHLIRDGYGNFAAEMTARVVNFFETHFQVEYPLSKLDSIYVPGKFAGGMENYGLITYGGSSFLIPDEEITQARKESLLSLFSHEVAHQWFGNLVTCKNWANLWLNEGLTSYAQYLGQEATTSPKEFSPRKYIQTHSVQRALKYDAGPNSHPVVSGNVESKGEIESNFDGIAYSKGASLIRMLEGVLGEKTLTKGLRRYLKAKAHESAEQDELFYHLNQAAIEDGVLPQTKTIKSIMDSWTLQKGFPVIRVKASPANRVTFSQEPFLNNYSEHSIEWTNKWEVPISLATQGNPNFLDHRPKFWLSKYGENISIDHDTSKWIIANLEGTGYFRVLYDDILRNHILTQLESDHQVISPLSRSQILDDYLSLGFEESISIESALKFTKYLSAETDYTVWTTVFSNFRFAMQLLRGSPAYEPMSKYFGSRVGGALKRIGVRQLHGAKGERVILRSNLLDWACQMGNQDCYKYSLDLFSQWKETPEKNPYPKDLQSVLFCASVESIGETAFDYFLAKYEKTSTSTERAQIISALGCSKNATLLKRLIDFSVDNSSSIHKEDVLFALNQVAANLYGRALIMGFLKDNALQMVDNYGFASVVKIVSTMSYSIGTGEDAVKLEKFIDDHSAVSLPGAELLKKIMKAVQKNVVWMSKFHNKMKVWFEEECCSASNIIS